MKIPMHMFEASYLKKAEKVFSKILNSKFTYMILFLIILAQFLLTSIIFFQNSKTNKQIGEKLNFFINQQNQLDNKINVLQSNVMRLTAQSYRTQGENK